MKLAGAGALVLLVFAAGPARAEPVKGADPALLEVVRSLAARVEQLRGQGFARPPLAVRADDAQRAAAAEQRAQAVLSAERLAARGRAWADLGLGDAGLPRRLMLRLASDLDGVGLDPTGNRLLVAPDRLAEGDFRLTEGADADATLLMMTGVGPDEPLVAHALMHLRQHERDGEDALAATTDMLLARAAWSEGESNLVAVRYLFEGMGLADEIIDFDFDPGQVLDGALLPPLLRDLVGIEGALVRFVYIEGFARVVEAYRASGWDGIDRAMERRASTRDQFHGVKTRAAVDFSQPVAPSPDHRLVDTDVLGEQAIVALVSEHSGKDNLGLLAGDGWTGDRLYRWEVAGDPRRGVTEWVTRWSDAVALGDYLYAMGRVLEGRFSAAAITVQGERGRRAVAGDRIWELFPGGSLEARVRITPAPARTGPAAGG